VRRQKDCEIRAAPLDGRGLPGGENELVCRNADTSSKSANEDEDLVFSEMTKDFQGPATEVCSLRGSSVKECGPRSGGRQMRVSKVAC
jgi:hypothetical protein